MRFVLALFGILHALGQRVRPFVPGNGREWVGWLIGSLIFGAFCALMGWEVKPLPMAPVWRDDVAGEQARDREARDRELRQPAEEHGQGWVPHPDAVAEITGALRIKRFADTPAYRAGDTEADAFLWNAWNKALGNIPPPRDQGQIGSCVSFGTSAAVDCLIAISFMLGTTGEYHDTVQEAVYGGSRVQIGHGQLGRGDGSVGGWAAEWVQKYGVIPRGKVGNYDLSTYSVSRCRDWGNKGCPKDLEPVAKLHPVKSITQVRSADEAKRALQNGYPIAVCSGQGFSSTRDADGFAAPRGSWAHCMAVLGYRVDKKGFFIWNSWGSDWIKGPLGPGTPPEGGFWCNWSTFDRMCRANDTWAFSDVQGWGARKIDWFVRRAPARDEIHLAGRGLHLGPSTLFRRLSYASAN